MVPLSIVVELNEIRHNFTVIIYAVQINHKTYYYTVCNLIYILYFSSLYSLLCQ
jgi:hypothetical protein